MPDPGSEPEAQPGRPPRALPARRRSAHRRVTRREWTFGRALLLTVVGALIPGTGLIAAGRRALGVAVFGLVVVLVGVAAWLVTQAPLELVRLVVDPQVLIAAGVVLAFLGLAWVTVIVISHRVLRPTNVTTGQRLLGSSVVAILALAVLLPMVVGSRYAFVQHQVVTNVFAGEESRSATRPTNVTAQDPWAGQQRVNVLLLGSDADETREGVRPDTVIVASIDTDSGNSILFSLPRNLMQVPFPPDSPLADVYPGGIFTGEGPEGEWMLNAIYNNVPASYPDLLDSDNPGADATKLAVGESLGLRIDYYVLVNLDGFKELIDALDGITVNINSRVPIGGSDEYGRPPTGWLEPGPDQRLDGYHALWFARGRYGSSDYDRMDRQRCVVKAIIDQADPTNVLRRYERIARTSQNIVETDIPQALLKPFVDLSWVVRDADVSSVLFDNEIITPANPDFDLIRSEVAKALESGQSDPRDDTRDAPDGAEQEAENPTDTNGGEDTGGDSGGDTDEPAKASERPGAMDSLEDTCAYHPEGAE